jgi:hypothetical protein
VAEEIAGFVVGSDNPDTEAPAPSAAR